MVQGQIEINLRGLCKGRGIIQRAELQGVTSWPINVGLITPRAVMDTSGACARLSSPPASSPVPPLRSMSSSSYEETERGRETIVAGMKRTLGNTGVTIDRFEKRIDRKFSPVPKHPLFRLDLGHIWSVHEFFPIVVRTCEKPCSPPPRIVMRSSKKKFSMEEKIYIYI